MSRSETFWRLICRYAPLYYILLVMLTVMAVLNGFAMLLAPQSTASFVASLMVFGILGITAVGAAGTLWFCNRR